MEKTIAGNFVEILKESLAEMPEGKIEFLGPADEFVSVTFIEGEILLVESTWGTGNDEIQRIYDWKTGTCVIKDLTPEEKKILETKWQRPVILDAVKKETKAAISLEHSVKVQTLLRDLKRQSLDLDAFLAEIQEKKYSGEARITTPKGRTQVLFYQGLPLLAAGRRTPTMREVHAIMDVLDATLNFYLLGDQLAHAFLSVFQGEEVWQGISVTVFHLDKMLGKLMEKHPTGHLCIHKGNNTRHYFFFFQGTPLGIYDIEKYWSPVDISTIWEDAQHVDYYLSGKIESFTSAAVTMSSSKDFRDFLSPWNDLVEVIAKKAGKRPAEKSLQKSFGGRASYRVEGIRLQLAGEGNQGTSDALKVFKEMAPDLLKGIEEILGRRWLNDQLQEFCEKNGDVIKRLSLIEVFSKKGG
ncbi:MAG: hypothetical protein MUO24_00115 [Desulfobacterales bacterium]|nr:hypothetical protein [Desulfobacterales bacterium]